MARDRHGLHRDLRRASSATSPRSRRPAWRPRPTSRSRSSSRRHSALVACRSSAPTAARLLQRVVPAAPHPLRRRARSSRGSASTPRSRRPPDEPARRPARPRRHRQGLHAPRRGPGPARVRPRRRGADAPARPGSRSARGAASPPSTSARRPRSPRRSSTRSTTTTAARRTRPVGSTSTPSWSTPSTGGSTPCPPGSARSPTARLEAVVVGCRRRVLGRRRSTSTRRSTCCSSTAATARRSRGPTTGLGAQGRRGRPAHHPRRLRGPRRRRSTALRDLPGGARATASATWPRAARCASYAVREGAIGQPGSGRSTGAPSVPCRKIPDAARRAT